MRAVVLAGALGLVVGLPGPVSAAEGLTGVPGQIWDSSNALGAIRGVGRTTNKNITTIRYTASGTAVLGGVSYRVEQLIADIGHYVPASRMDWTLVGPDGRRERRIEVVNGAYAWNETTPGMGASPAPVGAASDRLWQVWLTPHALLWSAVDKAAQVALATVGGRPQLTVPSPIDGSPMKVSFDAEHRPVRVEARVNGRATVVEYSDYRDLETYLVFFPHRIVQKVGGRTVIDLTVSEGHSNPYVVFPVPPEIRQVAAN